MSDWLDDMQEMVKQIPFGSSAQIITKNHAGVIAKVEGTKSESWKFKASDNEQAGGVYIQFLKDAQSSNFTGSFTVTLNCKDGIVTQLVKTDTHEKNYLT